MATKVKKRAAPKRDGRSIGFFVTPKDEATIQARAKKHFDGNVSAFLRTAALSFKKG